MSKRKKIVLVSVLSVVVLCLLFIGYHYVRYLQATSRMAELSADLEKRIAEWEKKEYRRQPLFGPAIKGNAAEFYQEAEMAMREFLKGVDWTYWQDYVSYHKPLNPKAQANYEKARPIIKLIISGNNAEVSRSLLNLREEVKFPDISALKNIANIMVIQGRELEKTNKYPEALQLYCEIIRFGDSYFYHSYLLTSMIACSISETGFEEIRGLLLAQKLSPADIELLEPTLKTLFYPEIPYADIHDTDLLINESYIMRFAKETRFFPTVNYFWPKRLVTLGGTIKRLITESWVNRTTIVTALEEVRRISPEIKRIYEIPYVQARQESENLEIKLKALKNPISQIYLYPTFLSTKAAYLQHQARCRGLYILCALQIYKARHQKYPDKLADLAPEIIPEVPLDPFTDQPFIYKVNQDGTILLYSVGTNLKDDNGTASRYHEEDVVIAPYLYDKKR